MKMRDKALEGSAAILRSISKTENLWEAFYSFI